MQRWKDFKSLKYIHKVVPKQANIIVFVALLLIVVVLFKVGQLVVVVVRRRWEWFEVEAVVGIAGAGSDRGKCRHTASVVGACRCAGCAGSRGGWDTYTCDGR